MFSMSESSQEPEKEKKKAVLHGKYGGGPHGVGDPNDKTLRRVEKDVLIPKIMRDKAREEKCKGEVLLFNSCCKDSGIKMVYKCQPQNKVMKECLTKWYQDEEFKKVCAEIYLNKRTEYRNTGIRESMKRMGS